MGLPPKICNFIVLSPCYTEGEGLNLYTGGEGLNIYRGGRVKSIQIEGEGLNLG